MNVEFVDTNVLVYAYDSTAGSKRALARSLVTRLWRDRCGALSTQVLQEFYVTVTRKLKEPLAPETALSRLKSLGQWLLIRPGLDDLILAARLTQSVSLSYWDALIVRAAQRARATTLWTEDLQDGLKLGELQICNPFLSRPTGENQAV